MSSIRVPPSTMTLSSMTGFGNATGEKDLASGGALHWQWDIKSVNARGLDLRLRLPPGFESLEVALRQAAKPLKRGAVSAQLTLTHHKGAGAIQLDEANLAGVVEAIAKVRQAIDCDAPRADGILALKGVLRINEDSSLSDHKDAIASLILEGFDQALNDLIRARKEEGAALQSVLSSQLQDIEKLVHQARALSDGAVAHHSAQLKTQMAELLADHDLSKDRLAQEAALLAVKTDIREELDRLDAHLKAAISSLDSSAPVGRALDFLAQEFVREANTLTTKAYNIELKQIGLSLKSVIDQFKEQVQNIL
ncbi:MAG: YicC/YloC family endoribonuclease [Pseudomonadota bacterium]